jgi:4-amino-4-deoxy-L-arabinose transferase-like glycosyltransferase
MGAVALVLTAFSNGYGFHRDELYFRMLRPGWGYVDQGPLTPMLVRWLSRHVADQPWAIRIPATASTVISVLVVALITRELGGRRTAQVLAAWAHAFAASPLLFGHVMLTSSLDVLVWPLVALAVIRAVQRSDPRWWLVAGVVVGLSMYNKLLIAMLLIALAAGIAAVGPRRLLVSPWVLGSAAVALLLGSPNLVYQATHGWPELAMGRALADNNAADVRVQMWPFLLLLLGPPLAAVWGAGWLACWRRPEWRPVRFLAAGFPVMLALVFVAGTQLYYPFGYLVVLFAAGCVPAGELIERSKPWRIVAVVGVAVNAVVSAVIALPLVPVSALGSTPIPGMNQTAGDAIGWPTYVAQIARVYGELPASQARGAVVVTSNYGEAGAVARFGPALGLPAVYAAQNQLYYQARPPDRTTTVVVVGGQVFDIRPYFTGCRIQARLDNGDEVDNEEQGEPVAVCRGPIAPWPVIWAALKHYD